MSKEVSMFRPKASWLDAYWIVMVLIMILSMIYMAILEKSAMTVDFLPDRDVHRSGDIAPPDQRDGQVRE